MKNQKMKFTSFRYHALIGKKKKKKKRWVATTMIVSAVLDA